MFVSKMSLGMVVLYASLELGPREGYTFLYEAGRSETNRPNIAGPTALVMGQSSTFRQCEAEVTFPLRLKMENKGAGRDMKPWYWPRYKVLSVREFSQRRKPDVDSEKVHSSGLSSQ